MTHNHHPQAARRLLPPSGRGLGPARRSPLSGPATQRHVAQPLDGS